MNQGKIIAVVGGPRSGKSFLVSRLAEYYKGVAILEGEESDFPERIREDIQKNIRPLERIVWFRNKLVQEYLKAIKKKEEGHVVITDNFWISYQLYIEALANDFEGELINNVALIDRETLPWPDAVILLTLSEEGVRNFIKRGGREFDQTEEFIQKQALPVHRLHEKFFSREGMQKNVLIIQRDELDFEKQEDLQTLIEKIEGRGQK
jgi:deoxyadenosine/deoxycytidine kinase